MGVVQYFGAGFRVLILIAFILTAVTQSFAQCPTCYYNETPMTGGCCDTDPTGLGRRVIKVKIDGSWDATPGQTNSNIWNGIVGCASCNPPLVGAVDRWNNATDSSGNHTNYYFMVDQSAQNPDIIIKQGTPASGSCASSAFNSTTGQWTTTLPAAAASLSQNIIAGRGPMR